MTRIIVGAVRGGNPENIIPAGVYRFNSTGAHAIGRIHAMAEILVHAAYLKSAGLIRDNTCNISFSGAKYQDFRGTKDHVRAHRAVFSVNVNGKNLVQLASSPSLADLIIAPQARTDPLPPAANYGDRLFEIVAAEPTAKLIRLMMARQRSNRPLEKNAVADTIGEMGRQYDFCYDQAILKSEKILSARGWEEQKNLLEGEFTDEQVRSFSLATGGPSQFLDLPQIFLALSKDISRHDAPTLGTDWVLETAAQLDKAKKD